MPFEPEPTSLSPAAFEKEVQKLLDATGHGIEGYESKHREKVGGVDGVYEIDILASFVALGVHFRVLVECKHQRRAVERNTVEVLHGRMNSVGAQKGILVSTAGFQRGTLEYASRHGIALIQLVEGRATYFTRADGPRRDPPGWLNLPPYAGWMIALENGNEVRSLVDVEHPEALRAFFANPT